MAEKNNENDLNDLLDNALQDFAKNGSGSDGDSAATAATALPDGIEDTDAFFLEQAKLVAERMNTLFGGANTPSGDIPPMPQDPDKITQGLKKMAEAAAMTLQGDNPSTDEDVARCSDVISKALLDLQQSADNLTAANSENDPADMFKALNLDGLTDGEGGNGFLPFMEGMMQSLLSAEILLPSIKELLEKYPKYLEENGDTIPAEDKERYEKQFELYKIIEGHLESESASDPANVKREKFKVVLEDMRRLQEFGQPPEAILAETGIDGDFANMNDLVADGAAATPQCPTM